MSLFSEWPGLPTEKTSKKSQTEMVRPSSQMPTGDAQ